MEALLSTCCRSDFAVQDRSRGELLYDAHGIDLHEYGSRGAIGIAIGSSGTPYVVAVDLSAVDRGELGVYCDCPWFAKGNFCKHTWAAIRETEKRIPLRPGYPGRLSVVECDPSLLEVGEPVGVGARMASAGGDISPIATAPSRSPGGTEASRSPGEARPRRVPKWKEQLGQLRRLSGGQDARHDLPALYQTACQKDQHWFVIDLADSAGPADEYARFGDRGHWLTVKLFRSTRGQRPGEWSAPRPVSIFPFEGRSVSNASERAAFGLLVWCDDELQPIGYHRRCSSLRLPEAAAHEALAALARTGRFVWSLEASRRLHDPQPVVWDPEAEPFRLTTAVEPIEADRNQQTARVRARAELVRGEETRPIGSVVAVFDDDLVLLEDQLVPLRPGDAGLVRAWQQTGDIVAPQRNLPALIETLLGAAPSVALRVDPALGVETIVGQPRGRLHLFRPESGRRGVLEAEVAMVYGDQPYDLRSDHAMTWDRGERRLFARDPEAESRLASQLPEDAFGPSETTGDSPSLSLPRAELPEIVRRLTEQGWEVIADGKLTRSAGAFHVEVDSGTDWFDLNAGAEFDGVTASLPELLKARREGKGYVVLDDGSHGILPEDWLSRFDALAETGQTHDDSVRFAKSQALLLEEMLEDQAEASFDRAFTAWCKKLHSFGGIRPQREPKQFQGELREYQRTGLGWLRFLREFELGGCLADDMGLGKTVQMLAMLLARCRRPVKKDQRRAPSIAVVPKSLIFNWAEEAAKFAPGLRVLDYTGTDRSERLQQSGGFDLLLTTYGTLRRDIEQLAPMSFDYAILDEAQAIKNPNSQACRAARRLTARHRLAMTGTPVENHLGDLWSLFEFLNPGMLGHSPALSKSAGAGDDERLGQISRALRPFILRRTKEQVLTELPEKSEQTLYCDMAPKQKKLYQELRDHYRAHISNKVEELGIRRSKIHVLEALLRLRQAACDPRLVRPDSGVSGAKIELLIRQLREVVGEGHKALVFSQFTSLLSLVKQSLDAEGYRYEYLDGQTTRRDQCVRRFQEDRECSLFLISLKAGGHGLNLTAADYVFILDPWWNPAVESQAIDRAHRMGQTQRVIAYRMICRETVEDKIVQLQQSKRQLADAIISQDKSLIGQLSASDLQMLFA